MIPMPNTVENVGPAIAVYRLPEREGCHPGFIVMAKRLSYTLAGRENIGYSTHLVHTRDEGKTFIATNGHYDMSHDDALADWVERCARG